MHVLDGQKVDLRQGQPSYPQQRSDLSGKDMEVGAFMDAGDNAPDTSPTAYVHIPPLLLRVMYQQLAVTWTRVRSLQQFTESWIDREQSDLGLLLLRLQLQLVHLVFKEEVLDLEQLCPGLSYLGEVQVPKNGYDIQRMDQQQASNGSVCSMPAATAAGHTWAPATGAQMPGSSCST